MQSYNFVDQNYQFNPATDVLIQSGRTLCDGMRVLVGDPAYRIDISQLRNAKKWIPKILTWHTPGTRGVNQDATKSERRNWRRDMMEENAERELVREALRYNRWCTVRNFHLENYRTMLDTVDFIGQYDDGTQILFYLSAETPWIAKKLNQ